MIVKPLGWSLIRPHIYTTPDVIRQADLTLQFLNIWTRGHEGRKLKDSETTVCTGLLDLTTACPMLLPMLLPRRFSTDCTHVTIATTPVPVARPTRLGVCRDSKASRFVDTDTYYMRRSSGSPSFCWPRTIEDCSASSIPHRRPQGLDVAEGDV